MQRSYPSTSVLSSEQRSKPKAVRKSYISFLLILSIFSCGLQGQSSIEKEPEIDPKVALNFINQYTGMLQTHFPALEEAAGTLEWVEAHPDASEDFKKALEDLLDEAEKEAPGFGLGFDPILDAQDFPDDGFVLYQVHEAGGYVTVEGKTWDDFRVRIKLIWDQGKWWVDGAGIVNIPDSEQIPR